MRGDHGDGRVRVVAVGVGGGGGRVVHRLRATSPGTVELTAIDADHLAPHRRPQLGELFAGAGVVLVTAGMGGGTGTGGTAVVAGLARTAGALTIGVVTRPFRFEGRVRCRTAAAGIEHLRERTDSVVVVANDRLAQVITKKTTLEEAYRIAADVMRHAVQTVAGPIASPGLAPLGVADARSLLANAGEATLGIGVASGPDRAAAAARQALACPLLETPVESAQRVLCTVTAGPGLAPAECQQAAEIVMSAASPYARVVVATARDRGMRGEVKVTVIACRPR